MTFVRDGEEPDGLGYPSPQEIESAIKALPTEITWDWAAPRLLPLFERGYGEGIHGDQMINTVSHLGVGIGFGIDFGPMLGRVTQSMARQWEASVEQIEHAAFAHLSEAAATVSRSDLRSVVHRGHLFRALSTHGGWASSLVLSDADHLTRIFGTRDAIFTVPSRNALIALAPATPEWAVAEVSLELESMDPHPLRLEPFVMADGVVRWQGLDDDLIVVT